jgi:hypothetical protein
LIDLLDYRESVKCFCEIRTIAPGNRPRILKKGNRGGRAQQARESQREQPDMAAAPSLNPDIEAEFAS